MGNTIIDEGKLEIYGNNTSDITINHQGTLVTYPTTQTHFDIPEELRLSYGLTPDLLRVSVGIEDIDDLLEDFLRALEV